MKLTPGEIERTGGTAQWSGALLHSHKGIRLQTF